MLAEDAADGSANQLAGDGVGAFELAFVFELEFAGDGRKGGVNIGDACDGSFFADAGGALLGVADYAFQRCDWQALADAGAAVHALVFTSLEGDFFDTSIFRPESRPTHASCWVIVIPSSRVEG